MRLVKPSIRLIARPAVDFEEVQDFLHEIDAEQFDFGERQPDGQSLIEIAGRNCYKSWVPGLNRNVTKVRSEQDDYLANIIAQKHGSVLEHAQWSFIINNVSRVFTHELVRHRVGVAISQESLRYVRLDELDMWIPDWARNDTELFANIQDLVHRMEDMQRWMATRFKLDDPDVKFSEKKVKTSFMRRFAPEGLATRMVWSANARTIRHVIEMRTSSGAEEEMRIVAKQLLDIMVDEAPLLFADYIDPGDGSATTSHPKI